MNIKSIFLAIVSLLLTACVAVDPQQFVGPNGKSAYSMQCSGKGRTLDACYQKAGEVCPSGYTIIDRASGTLGVPMSGGTVMIPQHQMAIECK